MFYSHQIARTLVLGKALYWVLNSLVVFVVGFGTAHMAADAVEKPVDQRERIGEHYFFISAAYAQLDGSSKNGTKVEPAKPEGKTGVFTKDNTASLKEQLERERVENFKLKSQIDLLQKERATAKPQQKETQFFRRW